MSVINVRTYTDADAPALAAIYYHTIHNINIRDYSEEQVNAWAPVTSLETEGWMKKWQKLSPFVAVSGEQVVGFAEFEPNGHIDCFYVHHEFQEKGVGSALMAAITHKAKKEHITRIFAEVSITARPFFEAKGFQVVKQQQVTIRGVELTNFVMERHLTQFTFRLATNTDKALIHIWWNKPHVKEFWDNSPSMWQNVKNYLDNGVKDVFDYWIGFYDGVPFALVMTSEIDDDAPEVYQPHRDNGITWSIDFMIGEESYVGKGLAPQTLQAFMASCPPAVTNFLIDPASGNSRAAHVYAKAGFKEAGRFTPEGGSFAGKEHILMRCKR